MFVSTLNQQMKVTECEIYCIIPHVLSQGAGRAVGAHWTRSATASRLSLSVMDTTATVMDTAMLTVMATRARTREVVTRGRSTGKF